MCMYLVFICLQINNTCGFNISVLGLDSSLRPFLGKHLYTKG